MENVIVERTYDQPVTADGLRSLVLEARQCLEQNRVSHVRTYIGAGGGRTVCLFHSPDAEAVRRVNRQVNRPAQSVWTSSVHTPPAAGADDVNGAELVVVERSFESPVAFEEIQALEDGGAWCLQQHRVHFLVTYFSRDRRRMLCLYRAPDAESVRLAQAKIGMPFDRVWTVGAEV